MLDDDVAGGDNAPPAVPISNPSGPAMTAPATAPEAVSEPISILFIGLGSAADAAFLIDIEMCGVGGIDDRGCEIELLATGHANADGLDGKRRFAGEAARGVGASQLGNSRWFRRE